LIRSGYGLRRGGGFPVTVRIPEREREGNHQQTCGQLAPGNLGGRVVVGGDGVSCRIFLAKTLGRRQGRGGLFCGIGQRGRIQMSRCFVKKVFLARISIAMKFDLKFRAMKIGALKILCAAIGVATTLFAAIVAENLRAAIRAGVAGGQHAGGQIVPVSIVMAKAVITKIVTAKIVTAKIVRGTMVVSGIVVIEIAMMKIAEIGQDGVRLNLTLTQGGEVIGYGFLFVESDLAGVGAHETFVEDAAGKLVEVLVLEGAEHAGADFGRVGDSLERDATLFALLAKFFSERSHGWLRQTGS
jgi:hypothetical protein